jgi:hypothetical protein
MSLSYPDLTGGSNITIIPERDQYIIIATASITYTLPTIVSNGSRYVFTRVDSSSNIVTLRVDPLSTDNISPKAGVLVSSVLINNKTLSEVISYNGVWYIFFTNSLSTISTPSFTAAFIGNSGDAFVDAPLDTWVPFLGTDNGDVIADLRIITDGLSNEGVYWSINSTPGGPLANIPLVVFGQIRSFYTSTANQIQFQPLTANPLYVRFDGGAVGTMGIGSFSLY